MRSASVLGVEWRRVWLVVAVSDDKDARREKTAATVTELRRLVDAARANSAVWHVRHESRRELAGTKPTHCACGREYSTAGSMATPHDWLPCPCGGHFWRGCRECGTERVEPPIVYDCKPRRPRPNPR